MGRDKSQLVYRGNRPQREAALELLRPFCQQVFLSVAREDDAPPFPCLVDHYPGEGPLNAIVSAFETHREVAWFILACDLPFLTEDAIKLLVERRSTAHAATAFRSAFLNAPDPLCAIYEPILEPILQTAFRDGARCPTDFLKGQSVQLLEPPDPHLLTNANTPEERKAALRDLDPE